MPLRTIKTLLLASLISGAVSTLALAGPACRQDQMIKVAPDVISFYQRIGPSIDLILARQLAARAVEDEQLHNFSGKLRSNIEAQYCRGSTPDRAATGNYFGDYFSGVQELGDTAYELKRLENEISRLRRLPVEQQANLEELKGKQTIANEKVDRYRMHFSVKFNQASWGDRDVAWGQPMARGAAPTNKVVNIVLTDIRSAWYSERLRAALDASMNDLIAKGPQQADAASPLPKGEETKVLTAPRDKARAEGYARFNKENNARTASPSPESGGRSTTPAASAGAPASAPAGAPVSAPASDTGGVAKDVINNIPGQAGSVLRGLFGR